MPERVYLVYILGYTEALTYFELSHRLSRDSHSCRDQPRDWRERTWRTTLDRPPYALHSTASRSRVTCSGSLRQETYSDTRSHTTKSLELSGFDTSLLSRHAALTSKDCPPGPTHGKKLKTSVYNAACNGAGGRERTVHHDLGTLRLTYRVLYGSFSCEGSDYGTCVWSPLRCSHCVYSTDFLHAVAPKKFLNLPLGAVRPDGWLHDQVRLLEHHFEIPLFEIWLYSF